jgi:hypothetical protein
LPGCVSLHRLRQRRRACRSEAVIDKFEDDIKLW